jgi:hypothetical protein
VVAFGRHYSHREHNTQAEIDIRTAILIMLKMAIKESKLILFRLLCFVDGASQYILVNKSNFVHNLFLVS